MRNVLVLLVMTLGFVACSSTKKTYIPEEGEKVLQVSLSKGACFGACPVYTFNMYKGGFCEFIGQENTDKIGTYELLLSPDKYKEISEAFKNANFFSFEDIYESKILDLPLIKLTYSEKEQSKTIQGKRERPQEIRKLQILIEQIAESETGWNAVSDETGKAEPEYIIDNSKIEITIKNGGQLSRWFDDARKNWGIRIVKRDDDSADKWIVSYSKNKYDPEEILSILQKDENIDSAEFLRIPKQ